MPKHENKEKLRKVAKGLGLGVLSVFAAIGIVATIAVLARCGEQPKQEASAEGVSLPYVRQPRKDAPEFSEDANVFKGDNFVSFANRVYSWEGNYIVPHYSANSGVAIGRVMTAGYYLLHVGNPDGRSNLILSGNFEFFDRMVASFAGTGDPKVDVSLIDAQLTVSTAVDRYVYVSPEQARYGWCFASRTSADGAGEFGLYALDLMRAEPSDKVSLPEAWKPFNICDLEPVRNGYGVARKRTSASLSPLGYGVVGGMLFRSNGKLYNRIEVVPWSPYVDNSTAHSFGYYDASGRLVWKSVQGDADDLIIYRVNYVFDPLALPNRWGDFPSAVISDEVAYCPETSVIVEQQSRVVYLSGGPLTWNGPLFRELDVLDVYDEQVKPTDTLVARSPLEWLRLSLADVNPTAPTDVGIGEGITLVSDGIVAFMPILGIEVLPSISLGLLLILPLIGGIIVLIVKVFSK